MPVYVAMLRGVNVAGHNLVKMAELRGLLETLVFEQCQTYIQSGNLVFSAAKGSEAEIAAKIAKGMAKKFGFEPGVAVRTATEMGKVIERNPFVKMKGVDVTTLHVTFLSGEPDTAAVKKLAELAAAGEEFRGSGREIYLYCPNGYGNTKLSNNAIEKVLGVSATTRNWKTVNKVREMALQCGKPE
ncbi:MAG TPA: DUF1697 domain-containing protein [Terriglobales bacterium]